MDMSLLLVVCGIFFDYKTPNAKNLIVKKSKYRDDATKSFLWPKQTFIQTGTTIHHYIACGTVLHITGMVMLKAMMIVTFPLFCHVASPISHTHPMSPGRKGTSYRLEIWWDYWLSLLRITGLSLLILTRIVTPPRVPPIQNYPHSMKTRWHLTDKCQPHRINECCLILIRKEDNELSSVPIYLFLFNWMVFQETQRNQVQAE